MHSHLLIYQLLLDSALHPSQFSLKRKLVSSVESAFSTWSLRIPFSYHAVCVSCLRQMELEWEGNFLLDG